ncbi:hypothetical protein LCGC14_1710460, partial [marine sediment metagenome]
PIVACYFGCLFFGKQNKKDIENEIWNGGIK